ncbi:MAG: hypothetical protein Kow0040_26610 [Thermogutta sp.]
MSDFIFAGAAKRILAVSNTSCRSATEPTRLTQPNSAGSTFFRGLDARLNFPGLEWLLIFCVFCIQGAWPVPDVNEPYYVGKAIHFWNPDFGPRDDFFASRDAHWVFYFSAGWLALVLPPTAMAWTIRLITWGLLAEGWRRLHRSVLGRGGLLAAWTALLFAAANDHLHMAGEWVIGGAEAKGIAYAALFFALAELAKGRYSRTWILLGVATAFHVLVGGWAMIATVFAWCTSRPDRPSVRSMIPYMTAAVVIALPGLVPSLMLASGASPLVEAQAHRIYVFHRLCHHLVPGCFGFWNIARFALLTALFLYLCRLLSPDAPWLRVRNFVLGAVTIAGIGMLLGLTVQIQPQFAAAVLRYYWFRLADAAIPLGTALGIGILAQSARSKACLRESWVPRGLVYLGIVAAAGHLGGYVVVRSVPVVPRAEWRATTWWESIGDPGLLRNYYGWRRVCRWVAENTPRDARFLTPRRNGSFKWYTGRSEIVTWKEIPQDAQSIVQWWNRLLDIHVLDDPVLGKRWSRTLAELREKRLLELAEKYDADYIVTTWKPTLDLELVFAERGNPFLVYRSKRSRPPERTVHEAVPSPADLIQP